MKPAVNQIELHSWLLRKASSSRCTRHWCRRSACATRRCWKSRDGSVTQVLIAWNLAKGFITLPKSVREARIKENLESVNVALSEKQIQTLHGLDDYLVTAWDLIKDRAV